MADAYNPREHITKDISASGFRNAGYDPNWRERDRYHPLGSERGQQVAQQAVSTLTNQWENMIYSERVPENDAELDEKMEALSADVDVAIEALLAWRKRMLTHYRCVP